MRQVTFFDSTTGAPLGHFSGPPEQLAINTPTGSIVVDGEHDLQCTAFDATSGEVVNRRCAPPTAEHEWSASLNRWILSHAAMRSLAARAEIDALERAQLRTMRELAIWGQDPRPEFITKAQQARARLKVIDEQIATVATVAGIRTSS